jgi:hypothetical protein
VGAKVLVERERRGTSVVVVVGLFLDSQPAPANCNFTLFFSSSSFIAAA